LFNLHAHKHRAKSCRKQGSNCSAYLGRTCIVFVVNWNFSKDSFIIWNPCSILKGWVIGQVIIHAMSTYREACHTVIFHTRFSLKICSKESSFYIYIFSLRVYQLFKLFWWVVFQILKYLPCGNWLGSGNFLFWQYFKPAFCYSYSNFLFCTVVMEKSRISIKI
jgi:hypothetical protein